MFLSTIINIINVGELFSKLISEFGDSVRQ